MALALITSYQLKSSAQGTTPLVTPSFTPANGEVISVTWETFDPAISLTITNSGSQSITARVLEQPGGFNGTAGISAGTVSGSPGSMTITGTPGASARYSMTVERWSGAQLAGTPVTNGNTATSGTAQSTLTPTGGAGGVIVWVSQDSQSVDPSARAYAGSGTDDGVRDDHVGSNAVGYRGYQTITGNTSQTYGLTAPIGQKWVIAGMEIQPAAGATLTYPPAFAARRRLQAPRRRRVAGYGTKTQFLVAPTYRPQVAPSRRLRALAPRRGRTAAVMPAQVVTAQPQPVFAGRFRVKTLMRTLRGRGAAVMPPQIIVQPNYVPPPVRSRARALWARPRRATAVPAGQQLPPAVPGRPRLKLPKFFRGFATQAPIIQVVAQAPAYVPPFLRARARFGRRPHPANAAAPVAQQVAPAAPAYIPPGVRARVRLARLFRGRSALVPIPQQVAPQAPVYVPPSVRVRARFGRLFRSRTAAVVPAQVQVVAPAYVPPAVRGRGRAATVRRTRGAAVPVPQVVPVAPPPYVPPFVRGLRRGLKLLRPRAFQVPANGQAAPPVPPVPPTPVPPQIGSWWGLVSVLREERAILAQATTYQVQACPNDGEPLRTSVTGIRYCPYDLWRPEGQVPIPRTGTGQDWGGLAGVLAGARADHQQDKAYGWISCPNDGEPLSRSLNGTIYCKYDLWMPPDQPSPDFPLNS